MPVVKVSAESMSLLILQARELEITVKDLLDTIILEYFEVADIVEEAEEEGEEEEEEEGSED